MIQKFRVPPKRSLTYRRRGVSGVKTFLGTGKNHCVDEKLFLSNRSLSSSSQEESSSSLLQFPAAWLAAPRVCRPSVVSFSFAFDHVLRLEPSPLLSLRLYSFLRVNSPPNRLLTPSLIPANARCHSTDPRQMGERGTRVEEWFFQRKKKKYSISTIRLELLSSCTRECFF